MMSAPWNLCLVDVAASLIIRNLPISAACLSFSSLHSPQIKVLTSQGSVPAALGISAHALSLTVSDIENISLMVKNMLISYITLLSCQSNSVQLRVFSIFIFP